MDYTQDIVEYIELEKQVLSNLDVESINKVLNVLVEALEKEVNVYIFGNGGSAATASHYVNDFNKGISESLEKKFRFICLNDNVSTMMAIANDSSYEEVFYQQLKGRLKKEDVVIAISGSGNSKNIVKAIEYTKEVGATLIGLSGYDGGKLKQLADYSLHVDIKSMQITEDVHMIFDHLMMSVLYKHLCHKEHLSK